MIEVGEAEGAAYEAEHPIEGFEAPCRFVVGLKTTFLRRSMKRLRHGRSSHLAARSVSGFDLDTTDPTRLAIPPPQGSIDRLVRFVLTRSRLLLTFEVSRFGQKWRGYDLDGTKALRAPSKTSKSKKWPN